METITQQTGYEGEPMSKIISIDDSAQIRNIIRGATEVLGYDFLEAKDGIEGMEVVAKHADDIALILLDVHMPRMDGFEVLRRLKKSDQYKQIPVMMVTTESEREAIVNAIKIGAENYVTKPFGQEELIMKMVETMGTPG